MADQFSFKSSHINSGMNQNYDYEQDRQQVEAPEQDDRKVPTIQQDYNYSKLTSDINELHFQFKGHQSQLKKVQKDIQFKITVSELTETIALINTGIHSDPNMIKLLKTREEFQDQNDQPNKLKVNALAFSRKLNQMCESLTILLTAIKKVQNRVTVVEADLTLQLNQKFNQLQTQAEEARSDQTKQSLQLHHKMQTMSFDLTDKLREMDTQLNWKLGQFKAKLDDKINEEMVLIYLQETEKKVDKNMREYQLKSNIDPDRINRIEEEVNRSRIKAENGITQCNYLLASMRKQIAEQLLHNVVFQENKFKIEKRLELFNSNFNDVYQRVKKCESQELHMQGDITILLADSKTALTELDRINTVLVNLKIGEDFQRMLQEMNPAQVLELQISVDGMKDDQLSIFKEIEFAKRQIDKINSKAEIMGVMVPNKARDKLKKEELNQALNDFLVDNQFAQKIAAIDRQLTSYSNSQEAVTMLARQVSRLQKQNDTHRLALQMRGLQEYLKKEIAFLHSKLSEKILYNSVNDRPGSYQVSNLSSQDPVFMKQALRDKSFSVKKMGAIQSLSSSRQIITGRLSKHVQGRIKKF